MELYNAINELKNNETECILDETMLPIDNLDLDEGLSSAADTMVHTLLGLVDSDGVLLKNKLLIPSNIEDMMNDLLSEESFQMLPECEFLAYYLSREYFKQPITEDEILKMKDICRVKANEKKRLKKLKQKIDKEKKQKFKIEYKKTLLEFK